MADSTAHARFPDDFWWGTASAGHQIEGGNVHSNWWAWEQTGQVNDGSVSGQACDYWNRWPEDHDLIESMGHNSVRMGVEWARIEPEDGRFDDEAIDRYVAQLSDLRGRGIKTCLTLYHWVLPQWLTEQGGWLAAHSVNRFERFVRRVIPRVAPHVDLWVTLNEPMVPVLAGYVAGYHPPCERNFLHAAGVFRALLEAHTRAYRAVHDLVPSAPDGSATMVGYAAAYQFVEPLHPSGPLNAPERAVGSVVKHVSYGAWDKAIQTGKVPLPFGRGQQIRGLKGTIDWLGVNYYMRISVVLKPSALSNVAAGSFDAPEGIEFTDMGWQVYPPGFEKTLLDAWSRLGVPIWITENGCADAGDELRRRYLLTHITAVGRAIEGGADIRGYFQWSLMDNFEWREGFEKRFGLIEVDFDDPALPRRPRQSAAMYREIIDASAVTPEIVERHSPGALEKWGWA